MIESEYNVVKENYRKWIDGYDLSSLKQNISKVNIHDEFLVGQNIVNHLLDSSTLTSTQKYNIFKIFIEDDKKMIFYNSIRNKKQFNPWAELCGMVGDIDSLKELVGTFKVSLIKNLNNGQSICYNHKCVMPPETLNFYSELLGGETKIFDLSSQIAFGEKAYLSYLKNCKNIKNSFKGLTKLLKSLLIHGYSEAFFKTFEKLNVYMKKPSQENCFGAINNDEFICLSILKDCIDHEGLALSGIILLPIMKELDRINPDWMDNVQIQKFLSIKISFDDLATGFYARKAIIFLVDYLHIDDAGIRNDTYKINNGVRIPYTEFQEGLSLKKLHNQELKIELPILLLYGYDGAESINYMMDRHPVETKKAIEELSGALDLLGLPMRSRRQPINSLFQKFQLEETICNDSKVGKGFKI